MTIIIGFDDTTHGRDALALGLLAAGTRGEPATVITVYPEDDRGLIVAIHDSQWVRKEREIAERKLEAARAYVGDRPGVRLEPVGPVSASRGLHEYAQQLDAHLLVVGSSAHGAIGRIALGSTVERLMHGAPCPIAVAPHGYHRRAAPALRVIAVAYDGTPEAQQALEAAVRLAERSEAALRLVAVLARHEAEMQEKLDTAAASVPSHLKATTEVITDSDVVHTLADLPDRSPELLVCGSRGYGPARQVLLGSVSSRVIRHAAYPVVVVPRGAEVE